MLPLPVFAVLAAPVAVIATALAIGQRDGLTLDRLLAAAWRQARSPRRMVTAPEGVPAIPDWVAPGLARQAGPAPAPVTPPWQLVTPDGVIGLGGDGAAAVCAVSTVNFALRSPAEQDALTAAYGRWLHSLTGPVQILIRTGHADLASAISLAPRGRPVTARPRAGTRRARPRGVPGRAGRHPAGADPAGAAGHPGSRPRRPRPARQRGRARRPAHRRGRAAAGQRRPASPAAGRRPGHRPAGRRVRPRRPPPRAAAGPARPSHQAASRRPGGRALPGAGQDGLPAPPAVEIAARHVEIDGDCAATLAVTGYPAEVAPGWLEPLTSYPGRLDIALHIEPVPPAVAADRLRRQRARLESSRRTWAGQGRLDDPATEAAAEDARALAYQVARGEGKLFRLGLYLTVHGEDPDDLAGQVAGVRALADSLLLSTAPATYRSCKAGSPPCRPAPTR